MVKCYKIEDKICGDANCICEDCMGKDFISKKDVYILCDYCNGRGGYTSKELGYRIYCKKCKGEKFIKEKK